MTDPLRLLDGECDDIERALLDSAVRDAPTQRAGHKTMAALGIGGGLIASGTSATTAAAAGAAPAAAAGTATTAAAVGGKVGIGVLVKWVGIAAVGGVATMGVVDQVSRPAAAPEPAVAALQPAVRQASSAARLAAAAQDPGQAGDPADPAELAKNESLEGDGESEQPAAQGAPSARPAAAPIVDAGLGAEVQALDRARTAMQAGSPDEALRALSQYDREFRRGALAPEARVLRIEALLHAGRRAEAQALARDFLASHPHSPHARRVRSLLGDGAAAGQGK